MKRRTFFQTAGAATTSVTLGMIPRVAQGEEPVGISADRTAVLEAPRRTSVVADVDVLVVGAGPAGVGAALAAARGGARTLLVEPRATLNPNKD